MRLVLIEKEANAAAWLAERLGQEGFRPRLASLEHPSLAHPSLGEGQLSSDAAVLDMGGSAHGACDIVRALRRRGIDQPLLVLSGNGNWKDRVDSLDAGADDYLVKPIRAEEVAARLRALIRRGVARAGDRIAAGPFEMDVKAGAAWLDGRLLDLTRDEFRLLRLFMTEPDRAHSHDAMREGLYVMGEEPSCNAIEVRIARLRRKIGRDRIRTIRGMGYRFAPGDMPAD